MIGDLVGAVVETAAGLVGDIIVEVTAAVVGDAVGNGVGAVAGAAAAALGTGDDADRQKAGPAVNAVVFDIGNVLLHWDPRHLYRELFDGDEVLMEDFLATVCTPAWNQEQDRGRSWQEGVALLTAEHPDCAELIRAFDDMWPAMVPGEIEGSVDILRRLKARGVPVYALTNFSREKFAETQRRFDFFALFDGIVVSAHEGLIKPDPALYRVLFDRYRLDPARLAFVDDSPANVATARELGMTAWPFEGAGTLERQLTDLGLL